MGGVPVREPVTETKLELVSELMRKSLKNVKVLRMLRVQMALPASVKFMDCMKMGTNLTNITIPGRKKGWANAFSQWYENGQKIHKIKLLALEDLPSTDASNGTRLLKLNQKDGKHDGLHVEWLKTA